MKQFTLFMLLAASMQVATAQNWLTTGNSGITTSNFLGTTTNADLIFKANNRERGRLISSSGAWRFGNATNFAKIDSTGKLTFGGTGAYYVGANKYAFQYSGDPDYGLFFNSSSVQYEFRNGSAVPVFYINANNGNGVFNGTLKVGSYTLPSSDGTNNQVLKTNGGGTLTWSNDNGTSYTAGTGINIAGGVISNTGDVNGGDDVLTTTSFGGDVTGTYNNLQLAANSVTANEIATGGVTTSEILDATIASADLNSMGASSGQVLKWNGSLWSPSTDNGTSYTAGTGINIAGNVISNTGDVNGADDANLSLSNLTFTSINQSLVPNTDKTINLGSYFNRWKTLFLSDGLYLNSYLAMHAAGTDNFFVGSGAGNTSLTGSGNIGLGIYALSLLSSGGDNTASGHSALFNNKTGGNNTAHGYESLFQNATGYENTATGFQSLYNNITSFNTAHGAYALYANITGTENTASGYKSLYSNTIGLDNTAYGANSLYSNDSGSLNTAIGRFALFTNKTGNGNTAMGFEALRTNSIGINNTANGANALWSNTMGPENTATGVNALYFNEFGQGNTASGFEALYSSTKGNYNTAYGYYSLKSTNNNYYGWNTAIGVSSLYSNTTGQDNTACGGYALYDNVAGTNNTALGFHANVSAGNVTNSTAIGNYAIVGGSNSVAVGNGSVVSIGGVVGWSNFSDGRYKKDIKENVQGLAFINSLRPITYTINVKGLNEHYNKGRKLPEEKIDEKLKTSIDYSEDRASKIVYNGFIAQEVEAAAKKLNFEFSGVDKPQNKDGIYGLRYGDFVVPLVKAVQELSKINEEKYAIIDAQQKQIDDLKSIVQSLQQNFEKCNPCAQQSAVSNQQSIKLSSPTGGGREGAASLEQNIPNPFNHTTTINYTLPAQYSSAKIIVVDELGKTVKSINLYDTGKGSINFSSPFRVGASYNYSLYVNGRLIDTKQMVLVK